MALSKAEIRKDTAQVVVESGAAHVGRIAGIVASAVRDVTREVGEFATDIFEMREAQRRAEEDAAEAAASAGGAEPGEADAEVVEPRALPPAD